MTDSTTRWAALLVPAVALLAFVLVYAHSFPVWETWYFIPVWVDFRNGGPWLADLFISRWGHITALPNFISLILDRAFNYDQRAGIFFSVAVMLATLYVLLTHYLPRSARLTGIFLGLTFLSLRAAEIWLDAWNVVMTVSLLLALAAGACVLRSSSWKALAACALLTFIGINSGGYCLPVLPAVLLVLLVQAWLGRRGSTKQALAQTGAWLAWCAVLLAYWRHMRRGHPGAVLQTALTPNFHVVFARELAFVLGNGRLGIASLCVSVAVFLLSLPFGYNRIRKMDRFPALVFLVIYVIVLGALIGTSRTLNGELPLHERYIPFLCLLPVALLAFAESVFSKPEGSWKEVMESMREGLRWLLAAFVLAAIYNDFAYWRIESANAPQLAALDRAWRESPWTLTPGMFMHRAHVNARIVAEGLATLRQYRLGPFARPPAADELNLRDAPTKPALHSDGLQSGWDQAMIGADGTATLTGWAFDTNTSAPPAEVFAVVGACSETALTGLPRPDVAAALHNAAASASGWLITLPSPCVNKAKGKSINVYFVVRDQRWASISRPL